jgi:hypothetical protein
MESLSQRCCCCYCCCTRISHITSHHIASHHIPSHHTALQCWRCTHITSALRNLLSRGRGACRLISSHVISRRPCCIISVCPSGWLSIRLSIHELIDRSINQSTTQTRQGRSRPAIDDEDGRWKMKGDTQCNAIQYNTTHRPPHTHILFSPPSRLSLSHTPFPSPLPSPTPFPSPSPSPSLSPWYIPTSQPFSATRPSESVVRACVCVLSVAPLCGML